MIQSTSKILQPHVILWIVLRLYFVLQKKVLNIAFDDFKKTDRI